MGQKGNKRSRITTTYRSVRRYHELNEKWLKIDIENEDDEMNINFN